MKPKWWWVPAGLVVLFTLQVWGFEMQQSPIQQSLPGYVLRGEIHQDSTLSTFTVSYPDTTMPDSVVLTLYLPAKMIEGAMDSMRVVYRPRRCR